MSDRKQDPTDCSRKGGLTSAVLRHTLIPPYGYNICGIWGTCAQWIDGFGVIIRK